MPDNKTVPELSFKCFLNYHELTEILEKLADSSPGLCRLGSIGMSRQGRKIHLLTITNFETGTPEDKPAYLIHGNIHASELAGTHAAVYTARQLLAEKPGLLDRMVFYIVPRINPDGAEFAVTTSGRIRSRSDETEKSSNSLYQQDIDGNGLILSMRQEHPEGSFIKNPLDPRLMIRRKFDSAGPYYRTLPEGLIYQWDGSNNIRIGGRTFDWNRNWSYDWRPEPEQGGAGDFPFSEPEMRALGEFIQNRSNIFGILGYHTGPAAVLRPPSTGKDADMDEGDVLMMDELAGIGSTETGFPVIPVVKYHRKNRRDINLRGHFHNFGYHHLGLFVFEFELGTIRNSAGISTEEYFSVTSEKQEEEVMMKLMKWWDGRKQNIPLFNDWKKFDHPQLGPLEIGGLLSAYSSNPALEYLEKISSGTYKFTLEHARRHPRIVIEELSAENVGGEIFRIRARIANRGAFPTNVTNNGFKLSRLKTVQVEFCPARGAKLVSMQSQFHMGHMAGVSSRMVEWFVASGDKILGKVSVKGGTGGNISRSVEI